MGRKLEESSYTITSRERMSVAKLRGKQLKVNSLSYS